MTHATALFQAGISSVILQSVWKLFITPYIHSHKTNVAWNAKS